MQEDDELRGAREKLDEACGLLAEGRAGASTEWVTAAESLVWLLQERYLAAWRRRGWPAQAAHRGRDDGLGGAR